MKANILIRDRKTKKNYWVIVKADNIDEAVEMAYDHVMETELEIVDRSNLFNPDYKITEE